MKSTADHQRDGTYRADRHGDRADGLYPKGPPAMPKGLDGHATWLWSLVTENVPERVISPADAAALTGLCQWWSTWRRLNDESQNAPLDKLQNLLNMESMVWKKVEAGLVAFGLTPAARTRLKMQSREKKGGGNLAALLKLKGQMQMRSVN